LISCVPAEEVSHTNKFACLTYHRVTNDHDPYCITEEQLKSHLELLTEHEFVAEGFEQLEARLRGEVMWPSAYAVLTFDDGHKSNMRASELLERYECTATFFLTRDKCGNQPGFIRTPDIRDLRRRGFSLGTHGTTHHKLTHISVRECVQELQESKRWLEDILGEEIRYMAAPGGYINSHILKLGYDLGYTLIGTCREQMNCATNMRLPTSVNRVNVRRNFSPNAVRSAAQGSSGFYAWRMARSLALSLPKKFA
jgi:peptidoglycan/xylan/chitin deacetylase (PgdA/CDA1 family)